MPPTAGDAASVGLAGAGVRTRPAERETQAAGEWRLPRSAGQASAPRRLVAPAYGRRDYYVRRALALGDLVAVVSALATALMLSATHQLGGHVLFGLVTLPVWLVIFWCYGLYNRDVKRIAHTTIDDIPGLFHAVLLGTVLSWLYFQATPGSKLTFITLLLFASLVMAFCFAARAAMRAVLTRMLSPERVLLVGTGQATSMLVENLCGDRRCHVDLLGRLLVYDDEDDDGTLPVLGRLEAGMLSRLLVELRVSRLLLASAEIEEHRLTEVMRECKRLMVKVSLLPHSFSAMGPSVELDDVGGMTVLGINPPVLSRSSRSAKRALDLTVAGVLAVASAPFLAIVAIAIKLDSRGPVLFVQDRIGQEGRRLKMIKFRTMVIGAEQLKDELRALNETEGLFKIARDPRVTRVGRLLRRFSLDELPQLVNVVRGEMSLVGPRPLVSDEDCQVEGWARGRLDLKPGMTGQWQILGSGRVPLEEMVKIDYLYVTNWSLWGDVEIILRTVPHVLGRRGV